jgi:hypothetical protein
MNYGFIITRHVNSEQTNKYWNQCIKLIRRLYPSKQIIIIDDNSNEELISADYEYDNLTIIKSEYPARGELLPFIYFLKYKWFDNAVIIHDSVFIHKRIPFEILKYPVIPLWHHPKDKENIKNQIRILGNLKNNRTLYSKIYDKNNIFFGIDNETYDICFGCQCFINLRFLQMLEFKYKISNLINAIYCRTDRCSLERVMGLLFNEEFKNLKNVKSLFGRITVHYKSFEYYYPEYWNDFQNKKIVHSVVKIWTGR